MRRSVILLFLPLTLSAADPWLRIATPHFELYTSAGESKGREVILYFEQVRSFFLQASPAKRAPDFPVRIIAFRGEKEYKPYRLNVFASAFYMESHDRDYIVMGDVLNDHYPAAIHEYTHLIIQHSGMKLPVWMNEGWAELYSTLKPMGDQARIGDVKPGWLRTLAQEKWLPIGILATVDHQSAYYNEADKAGIFYAESWALMHMLYFDPRYRENFDRFVLALAGGSDFAGACQKTFGRTVPQIESDLKAYFSKPTEVAIVPVNLAQSELHPAKTVLPSFESRLVLADLLVVTNKTGPAKRELNALAAQNPARPEVEESLGYLAWQNHDLDGAREHFARAVAEGTSNSQVCLQYAQMEPSDKSLDALRRAVSLKPDFSDAWMQLGIALMNRYDFAGALAAFDHIRKFEPEQASKLFAAKAYALLKTGDKENARKNAEDARKSAKTTLDRQQAESILQSLGTLGRE